MNKISREGLRFLIVGGTAFVIGVAAIHFLTFMGVPELVAQFPALALCVVLTWWLNRRWSFAVVGEPSCREFGRYVVASGLGLALNAATFSALILLGWGAELAYAAGTGAGMISNFLLYRTSVFNRG